MSPSLVEVAGATVQFFGSSGGNKIEKLQPTLKNAVENPRAVGNIFYEHYQTIKHGFSLNDKDLTVIQAVNQETHNPTGWDEFLGTFGEHSELILETIRHMGDLNQNDRRGLRDLSRKMQTAQKFHKEDPSWKPDDKDKKKSGKVIWGYLNDANDTTTDLYFSEAHAIERILTQKLKHIPELRKRVKQKDWFVHPLTDLVILQGVKGQQPEQALLAVWEKPRPEGLGWASQKRIGMYTEKLAQANLSVGEIAAPPSTNSIR